MTEVMRYFIMEEVILSYFAVVYRFLRVKFESKKLYNIDRKYIDNSQTIKSLN